MVDYSKWNYYLRKWRLIEFDWVLYGVSLFAYAFFTILNKSNAIETPARPFYVNNATQWYPYHEDSVPTWAVAVFGIICLLICMLVELLIEAETHRIVSYIASLRIFLGGGAAACITLAIVEFFKLFVGKLRPDFLMRCLGEIPNKYSTQIITDNSQCVDTGLDLIDGRKAYPSGHSALSFCFATFLVGHFIYAAIRLKQQRQLHILSQLVIMSALFPWIIAFWVGCTRIIDNKHEAEDVNAGAFVGTVMAILIVLPLCFSLQHDYNENAKKSQSSTLMYTEYD